MFLFNCISFMKILGWRSKGFHSELFLHQLLILLIHILPHMTSSETSLFYVCHVLKKVPHKKKFQNPGFAFPDRKLSAFSLKLCLCSINLQLCRLHWTWFTELFMWRLCTSCVRFLSVLLPSSTSTKWICLLLCSTPISVFYDAIKQGHNHSIYIL